MECERERKSEGNEMKQKGSWWWKKSERKAEEREEKCRKIKEKWKVKEKWKSSVGQGREIEGTMNGERKLKLSLSLSLSFSLPLFYD